MRAVIDLELVGEMRFGAAEKKKRTAKLCYFRAASTTSTSISKKR